MSPRAAARTPRPRARRCRRRPQRGRRRHRRARGRGVRAAARGDIRRRAGRAGQGARRRGHGGRGLPRTARGAMRKYALAFVDWLACAARGRDEPAARAALELDDPVVHAGVAGHVLDFDDTYLPGIAHLSAPVAPVALLLGAELGRSAGDVLAAYAEGFEAMGAIARAGHPALYDRGWH